MKKPKYLDDVSDLLSRHLLTKFVMVCLVLMQVVLTAAVLKALNYQRTILVPMGLSGTAEITGDRANEDYLRACARAVLDLALNVSPSTVRSKFEELLVLYSPRTWGQGKRALYSMARDIEEGKISAVFYPQEIVPDVQRRALEITGHRKMYTDNVLVKSRKKTYVLRYEIVDGRFQVLGFAEKEQKEELEKVIEAASATAEEDAS